MGLQLATVLRTLKDVGRELREEYEYINHGGCALVAYSAAEALQEIGVRCDVVAGDIAYHRPAARPSKVRRLVEDANDVGRWDYWGLGRNHFATRIRMSGRTVIWDTDGVYTGKVFGELECLAVGRFGTGLTAQETRMMYWAGAKYWNETWDRGESEYVEQYIRDAIKELH